MIVDQGCADASHLVGTDCGTDAAAADRNAPLHLSCGHSASKRDDKVGIIIAGIERVSSEIDYVVPSRTQLREHLFLQGKSPMIGCQAHVHDFILKCSFDALVRDCI